ncbi:hypothetical protein J8J40_34890, partial [Mycobacterium tuberculosis]|nr:hypothetical protein [Mycobacterium tuberculosis]
ADHGEFKPSWGKSFKKRGAGPLRRRKLRRIPASRQNATGRRCRRPVPIRSSAGSRDHSISV